MRRSWVFLLLLVLTLGGCQYLSHPFAEDHDPPGAPILTVKDSVGIAVAPVAGAPEPASHALADAMAAALREADVPAETGTGNKHSYRLTAEVEASPGAPGYDQLRIRWTMFTFDGKEAGHDDQSATIPTADWDQASGGGLQTLAKAEAPALAGFVIDSAPVEHKPMQQVFVRPVTGAPGDGDRALPSALSYLLKRRGIDLAADASAPGTITIAGAVAVTPADGGQDRVQIAWHVLRPDGGDVGQIAQDNTVPHGSLDGRWGQVAMAVAMAGVDDILRVAGTIPAVYVGKGSGP